MTCPIIAMKPRDTIKTSPAYADWLLDQYFEVVILQDILRLACKYQVSDVFIKEGSVPRMRHKGKIILISGLEALSSEMMESIVKDIMPERLMKEFTSGGDTDFSFKYLSTYFRANLYRERENLALVLRLIKSQVPTFEELRLPEIITSFAKYKTGLVLVTGATGSGKSSTLASIIQHINANRSCHIVTIEDPIEYRFREIHSTVSQREIGVDAQSFPSALRASLRQSPDVILVGELRDRETTEVALTAAETGHLVLSTMHTLNSVSTLSRLMSYFDPSKHSYIRLVLANSLNATIAQKLIPSTNKDLICAHEVMIVNSYIRDQIRKDEHFYSITKAIEDGHDEYGMCTFDQSLLQLYLNKYITHEVALANASVPANLALQMHGVG